MNKNWYQKEVLDVVARRVGSHDVRCIVIDRPEHGRAHVMASNIGWEGIIERLDSGLPLDRVILASGPVEWE
jgi:hypothetical protein